MKIAFYWMNCKTFLIIICSLTCKVNDFIDVNDLCTPGINDLKGSSKVPHFKIFCNERSFAVMFNLRYVCKDPFMGVVSTNVIELIRTVLN
jgi:hypothetical protein